MDCRIDFSRTARHSSFPKPTGRHVSRFFLGDQHLSSSARARRSPDWISLWISSQIKKEVQDTAVSRVGRGRQARRDRMKRAGVSIGRDLSGF